MKQSASFLFHLLIINFLICPFVRLSAQNKAVLFQSGNFVPHAGINYFFKNQEQFRAVLAQDRYYVLMQFDVLPNNAQKQMLKNKGIILSDFIPNNAFLATIPKTIIINDFDGFSIRAIDAVPLKSKIAPALLGNNCPAYIEKISGYYDVKIKIFPGIDPTLSKNQLQALGATVLSDNARMNVMELRVQKNDLIRLAAIPWITWILPITPEIQTNNNYGRPLHRDNVLTSTLSGQRHLSGQGVRVGIFDEGDIYTHIDLKRRTNHEYAGPVSYHSTHCSGTITGAGLMDPNGKGMAPEASLYSWSFFGSVEDTTWYYEPVFNYKVTSNSFGYGSGFYGGYDYNSWVVDTLAYAYKNVSQIFAAGNSGSSYSTVSSGGNSGKNTITIGALDRDTIAYFSSRGPVNDGRIKPEVCALGYNVYSTLPYNTYDKYSGTSMATPGTAGTVALLYQRYRQLNAGADPQSDLIKAVLLNSAYDLGNPGPDYTYGFGRIDALAAVTSLESNSYSLDSVNNLDTVKMNFTVNNTVTHVRFMLNWTDVPATGLTTKSLVNDLDLVIINPKGDTLLPWILDPANPSKNAVKGRDTINVEEQISADTFFAGAYQLLVIGKSVPVGPQHFAITWFADTTHLNLTSPLGGETYSPARQTLTSSGYQYVDSNQIGIGWESSPTTNNFIIYFSADHGSTWTNIGTAPGYRRNFFWRVPDTSSSQCLIKITNGSLSSISDSTFTILKAPQVIFSQACLSNAVIVWNKIPHAVSYDVLRLKNDSSWQVLKNITDTFYIDSSVSSYSYYWYSIRAVEKNNGISQQAIAVNLNTGSSSCFAKLDAGISNIDSPSLGFCTGPVAVYVHLNNYGLVTLTSATISWTLNGVKQTPFKWTGSLGIGASTSVNIGSVKLTNGFSYNIKAYTMLPNGGIDGNVVNDSTSRNNIQGGLSGTYSVGIISPIYPSISSAINDLNNRGVCGALTLQILDGNYTEQTTINQIRNTSAVNTITIESASGDSSLVNWNYPNNTGDNFVFRMYGTNYLTLRNITLQRTGTGILSTSRVLNISGGANHISVHNNALIGVYGASTLAYFTEGVDSNISFYNNYLKYGNYGVYLCSYYGYNATNNMISGNLFDSTYISAVYAFYQSAITIKNNIITHLGDGDNSNYIYGLQLESCHDSSLIESNKIDIPGINTQAYGISISSSFASSSAPALIANNFISMSCFDSTKSPYGINLYYTYYQNIYFNNVHLFKTNSNGVPFISYYNYGGGNNVENNNFVNHGGPYALYINPSSYFDSVNYNNLVASGSVLADWNGTDYSSLSSYISGTAQNNTLNADPLFISNTDLHVASKSIVQQAKYIATVPIDIDGQTRASVPTIGADEISYNDAGINILNNGILTFCDGTESIMPQLKNFGLTTISSTTINWSINGTLQKPLAWTGTLKPGDSTSVTLGSYLMLASKTYNIKIWTSKPNGAIDYNHRNDSLTAVWTINPHPMRSAIASKGICKGDSISLGASAIAGHAYAWTSIPSGFTSTTSAPYVKPTTMTVYVLNETITSTSCSRIDSVIITVNPKPAVSAGSGSTICAGTLVSIGNAPTPGHKYVWSSMPSGFKSSSSSPSVNPKDTTTYFVYETDTATGCFAKDSVTINVNPVPSVKAGTANNICAGTLMVLGASPTSGYSYHWSSKPSGFSSSLSNPSIKPSTTTTYYLMDSINATGCTAMDSVTITVYPLPSPAIGTVTNICNGTKVNYATANHLGSNYQWKIPRANIISGAGTNTIMVNWTSAGKDSIQVTETDHNGCKDSNLVHLSIYPNPIAKFTVGKACSGIPTVFIDSSSTTFKQTWYFGDGDSSSNIAAAHAYSAAGAYHTSLVVQDSNACVDTARNIIQVDTGANAKFTFAEDLLNHLLYNFKAIDTTLNANAYLWNFGDTSTGNSYHPSHLYKSPKRFEVSLSVTLKNGCSASSVDSTLIIYTGITDTKNNSNKISVAPNPSNNQFVVSYTLDKGQMVKFSLFTMDGKTILDPINSWETTGAHQYIINASELKLMPGVYLLQVQLSNEGIYNKKLIFTK